MVHLAVTDGTTEWAGQVTGDEYQGSTGTFRIPRAIVCAAHRPELVTFCDRKGARQRYGVRGRREDSPAASITAAAERLAVGKHRTPGYARTPRYLK